MDNKLYKLMNWPEIESIIYSECDSPQDILGMHTAGQNQLVQAFFPNAEYVNVLNLSDDKTYHMEKVDEEGFFACLIPSKKSFKHEYLIEDKIENLYIYDFRTFDLIKHINCSQRTLVTFIFHILRLRYYILLISRL